MDIIVERSVKRLKLESPATLPSVTFIPSTVPVVPISAIPKHVSKPGSVYVFKNEEDFFKKIDYMSTSNVSKIKILRFKQVISIDKTFMYIIKHISHLECLYLHNTNLGTINDTGVISFKSHMPGLKVFAIGETKMIF